MDKRALNSLEGQLKDVIPSWNNPVRCYPLSVTKVHIKYIILFIWPAAQDTRPVPTRGEEKLTVMYGYIIIMCCYICGYTVSTKGTVNNTVVRSCTPFKLDIFLKQNA